MNTFAVEIWYDEGAICTFYTVRWLTEDDDVPSETDRFFDTYADEGHPMELKAMQLFRLITGSIANKYGASDDFFGRTENKAQALPPRPMHWVEEVKDLGINFPLRLYCHRITQHIVVLFNGGIKASASAQESKSVSIKFHEAQIFVKKIEDALQSGVILISADGRYLKSFDKSKTIIL